MFIRRIILWSLFSKTGRRDNKQKLSNSGYENVSYGPKYNRLVCDIHLIIESNVLMHLLNIYFTQSVFFYFLDRKKSVFWSKIGLYLACKIDIEACISNYKHCILEEYKNDVILSLQYFLLIHQPNNQHTQFSMI